MVVCADIDGQTAFGKALGTFTITEDAVGASRPGQEVAVDLHVAVDRQVAAHGGCT